MIYVKGIKAFRYATHHANLKISYGRKCGMPCKTDLKERGFWYWYYTSCVTAGYLNGSIRGDGLGKTEFTWKSPEFSVYCSVSSNSKGINTIRMIPQRHTQLEDVWVTLRSPFSVIRERLENRKLQKIICSCSQRYGDRLALYKFYIQILILVFWFFV